VIIPENMANAASYILLYYECMVVVLVAGVSSGIYTRVKSGAVALPYETE
jgi:hypothetical protein